MSEGCPKRPLEVGGSADEALPGLIRITHQVEAGGGLQEDAYEEEHKDGTRLVMRQKSLNVCA